MLPREKGTDKTTDWKAILTKLRGRNPDAVFYGGMDATGGPLLKQGRELGIKAVFSFGDGACTDKMKELAGDAAEGCCARRPASRRRPRQEVPRRLQEEVQRRPDPVRAVHLRRGQPADRGDEEGRIRPIRRSTCRSCRRSSFNGATGTIAFDDKGDRKDAEMTIFTMKGGKLEPIAIVKGGKTMTLRRVHARRNGRRQVAQPGAVENGTCGCRFCFC